MFQRILLAWDGSEVALRAFDAAIDITRRYEAELTVVSIAYSPAHAETAADRAESTDAARRYLETTFDEVKDRAERAGVEAVHEIVEGDTPARALLAYVHRHGTDLIVCGQHHERRAGRMLLKGITQDLLVGAPVPVLVVSDAAHDA
ncbi:MAG TPA: universal stress protein [Solirubrobacteraceae bacterium]|nr:universal stress protein [Solirubrobacteraceae bacterium]